MLQDEWHNPQAESMSSLNMLVRPKMRTTSFTAPKIFSIFVKFGFIKPVIEGIYTQQDIKDAYSAGVLQSYRLIQDRLISKPKRKTKNTICQFHNKKMKDCPCI